MGICYITSQNTSLNCSTDGNSFIRIDRLAGGTTKNFFDSCLNLWHSTHSTNNDNLSNVSLLHFSILNSLLTCSGSCVLAQKHPLLNREDLCLSVLLMIAQSLPFNNGCFWAKTHEPDPGP